MYFGLALPARGLFCELLDICLPLLSSAPLSCLLYGLWLYPYGNRQRLYSATDHPFYSLGLLQFTP